MDRWESSYTILSAVYGSRLSHSSPLEFGACRIDGIWAWTKHRRACPDNPSHPVTMLSDMLSVDEAPPLARGERRNITPPGLRFSRAQIPKDGQVTYTRRVLIVKKKVKEMISHKLHISANTKFLSMIRTTIARLRTLTSSFLS